MKWTFADLERYYKDNIPQKNFTEIFDEICDIATKTLIGVDDLFVETFNRNPEHRNNCFELFGFDFMIDENFKSWLIEVRPFSYLRMTLILLVQCRPFYESRFKIR